MDTDRIVIDLTARDGLQPEASSASGATPSPSSTPSPGEVLGELDQELATGKVTEVREKFSVVEIQSVSPGAEIKVKDQVIVR